MHYLVEKSIMFYEVKIAQSPKETDDMKEKVEEAIKQVRPMLQRDGGDIELVDVAEDGTVKVRLKGACGSCPMSTMTLKMGVEKFLKEQIPAVKEVVQVA